MRIGEFLSGLFFIIMFLGFIPFMMLCGLLYG